jgi:hypothetical protein
MKREIRDKRNEYREASVKLRHAAHSWDSAVKFERCKKIQEEQNDRFKRFKFFDGMIKANEKVKEVKK